MHDCKELSCSCLAIITQDYAYDVSKKKKRLLSYIYGQVRTFAWHMFNTPRYEMPKSSSTRSCEMATGLVASRWGENSKPPVH